MKCKRCNAIRLNSVLIHESIYCPESWRELDTGKLYPRECSDCGCEFTPDDEHQRMCFDCTEAQERPEWLLLEYEVLSECVG